MFISCVSLTQQIKTNTMTTTQLNKEYKKIAKRYYSLENNDYRTFDEQRELDTIEIRMSEISNLLENA